MPNNQFGDFQTPLTLALQCLRVLDMPENARVLEPTCGHGSFLEAAHTLSPSSERIGIELQPEHASSAAKWASVKVGNIFNMHIPDEVVWRTPGPLYVVGNPPWVTSAELNRMDSKNLPPKENFKGAKGLDAILGSSNFDVCEFIILKLLNEYRSQPFTLGMLCKTQVARKVIEHAEKFNIPLAGSAIYRIDAMKWFSAGVDACWFTARVDPRLPSDYTCAVNQDVFFPALGDITTFGVIDGLLVSDIERYKEVRAADGAAPYEWRSGLKHDAAGVFELLATPSPATKAGEPLDLEAEYLFPFLKSTDIFRGRQRDHTKWVIVPQATFGAETKHLAHTAPKLWAYLSGNAAALDGRKSSIYLKQPRFSVFGHGAYTYAPYKVAISGLHKEPIFRLVGPLNGQPVVLDDTCYFLPFSDATEAALVTAALNSKPCFDLIESMVFWDSKRPITKKLLARLDLNRLPMDSEGLIGRAAAYATEAGIQFDEGRADSLIGKFGADAASRSPTLF